MKQPTEELQRIVEGAPEVPESEYEKLYIDNDGCWWWDFYDEGTCESIIYMNYGEGWEEAPNAQLAFMRSLDSLREILALRERVAALEERISQQQKVIEIAESQMDDRSYQYFLSDVRKLGDEK